MDVICWLKTFNQSNLQLFVFDIFQNCDFDYLMVKLYEKMIRYKIDTIFQTLSLKLF